MYKRKNIFVNTFDKKDNFTFIIKNLQKNFFEKISLKIF
jgi:hypothetical protein